VDRLKAGQARQPILLTVPPTFADRRLLPRVERFQASHPRVDAGARRADFNADRIDLGILYGRGCRPSLVTTRLFSDTFFPVCARMLASGHAPPRTSADLDEHALIHDVSVRTEPALPTWRAWLAHAKSPALDADRGLQINDSAAVIQASITGSGSALGRSHLVQTDQAARRLVRPLGDAIS
jgi:LysR family glycine cleavage system transcriptional activator